MSQPELKRAYWRFVELEKSREYQEKKEDLLEWLILWIKRIFKKKRQK